MLRGTLPDVVYTKTLISLATKISSICSRHLRHHAPVLIVLKLGLLAVQTDKFGWDFDKLMQAQLRSIEEGTPPKRNKCGIIHFVNNFGEFASITENICRNSDRRSDIEKWYMTLISSMIDNIPR